MTKHLVSDTFELNGRWWLPGHEDKAIAGTLHYSPEAIKLKLHGVLTSKQPVTGIDILRSMAKPEDDHDDDDQLAAVFGETKDGLWSLINAFSTSTNIGWTGIGDCTYSANLLVQGGHVSSLELPCSDIRFGSTLHDRFFKLPIFEIERSPVGDPWSRTLKYVGCKQICYQTEPTEELRLNSSLSESPNLHSFEICNRQYFRLIASTPQPLRRQLDRMWSVCNLFTLLTDDVVAPTYCDARIESEKDSIRVFYTARDRIRSKTPKAVLPLLKLDQVENILETALQRWLAAEGQVIGSAILLFLEGRENNYPSIEGQFLVLTQGLEAISRAIMTSEYMNDVDYNEVRQALYAAIPATVDPSHRASLRNRIKYGNGHSLRKRIENLLGSLEEETQRLVCKSTDAFVSGVVETRNYLNHYTDELRAKAFNDGEQMHWANVRMTMLLRILLLKYVGLDEGTIRAAINAHNRLRQSVKAARHFPESVTKK